MAVRINGGERKPAKPKQEHKKQKRKIDLEITDF